MVICFANFDGPSTGMETKPAEIIWSQSTKKHKMRCTSIISNGDNKTWGALNQMKVYGDDAKINKLECVNHIHKQMGTGLRNLVKKSHVKGGSGGLTGNMINKLSGYYCNHITDHVTKSNDPIVTQVNSINSV